MIRKWTRTLLCLHVMVNLLAIVMIWAYLAQDKNLFILLGRIMVGGVAMTAAVCAWVMVLNAMETEDK